jgi:hypothetical protein
VRRLLLIVFLLPHLSLAQEGSEREVELEVKPVLCVTDSRNPSCELSFVVRWRSVTRDYYCVFNDFGDGPLNCWEEAMAGETTDERDVEQSFTFWMTGEDLERRLAEVAVEVLQLDSGDRRRKRRTRHVWDIN